MHTIDVNYHVCAGLLLFQRPREVSPVSARWYGQWVQVHHHVMPVLVWLRSQLQFIRDEFEALVSRLHSRIEKRRLGFTVLLSRWALCALRAWACAHLKRLREKASSCPPRMLRCSAAAVSDRPRPDIQIPNAPGRRILLVLKVARILARWLDLYLGVVKGHWKNSLKIAHVTNTHIGGMYAFTMNSHNPKGLMRL